MDFDSVDHDYGSPHVSPLSHAEGLKVIDEFYPSPEKEVLQPQAAVSAPPPQLLWNAANEAHGSESLTDDGDPFALPMEDDNMLSEGANVGTVVGNADVVEQPYNISPSPYAINATPTASSGKSLITNSTEDATENRAKENDAPTILLKPALETPSQPKQQIPSSGSRRELQDEMRVEDDDRTAAADDDDDSSPVKLTLPGLTTPRRSPLVDRTLDGDDIVAPSGGFSVASTRRVATKGMKHARTSSSAGSLSAPPAKRAKVITKELPKPLFGSSVATSGVNEEQEKVEAGGIVSGKLAQDHGELSTVRTSASRPPVQKLEVKNVDREEIDSSMTEIESLPTDTTEGTSTIAPTKRPGHMKNASFGTRGSLRAAMAASLASTASHGSDRRDSIAAESDADSNVTNIDSITEVPSKPALQTKTAQDKAKGKAKDTSDTAQTDPAGAKPPYKQPTKRQLREMVSSMVMNNIGSSPTPRQTRGSQKRDENAKPSAAAKSRHRGK